VTARSRNPIHPENSIPAAELRSKSRHLIPAPRLFDQSSSLFNGIGRFAGSVRFGSAAYFDGEHSFHLEPDGRRTHLIQAERFSGILVGRLSDGILRKTQRGFVAMNEALKRSR
jgi:hypothetical protein